MKLILVIGKAATLTLGPIGLKVEWVRGRPRALWG